MYDRGVAMTRAQLGNRAFMAAWAAGYHQGLDAALREALDPN